MNLIAPRAPRRRLRTGSRADLRTRTRGGRILTLLALAAAGARGVTADDSLARCVPQDVGLFVEVRDAGDLLTALSDPALWQTLAEWAGQPARLEDVQEWAARVRETVGMEPAEAIRALFARRVAFVGGGLGQSQDGAVLCRPAAAGQAAGGLAEMLSGWGGRQLPNVGRASVFLLKNGIAAAAQDGLLLFGDAGGGRSMFRRVLPFTEPNPPPALAEEPLFRALLARVPRNPDGVLWVRLPLFGVPTTAPATATQPFMDRAAAAVGPPERVVSELPGPLRGASHVLLALHRDDHYLHFSAVGDADVREKRGRGELVELAAALPERTLFAWVGHVDYEELYAAVDLLPQRNVLRQMLKVQEKLQTAAHLTDALGTATCVAIGAAADGQQPAGMPPLPAAALLIGADDADQALRDLDALVDSSLTVYKLFALRAGWPALGPVSDVTIGGAAARVLDLTALVEKLSGVAAGPVHLAWALDRNVLIVSSQRDWLEQILAARRRDAGTLEPVLRLTQRPISPQTETICVVQSGPIADLGGLWLTYLKQTAPQVLDEGWWRSRQPGGRVQLGVDIETNAEAKSLRVTAVAPGTPAAGILEVNDEIVGANDRPFATTQPVAEIQRAIDERPNARWIDLQVRREGVKLPPTRTRIPLPFVDPIYVLHRALAIGKFAQRVVYYDDVPDAAGPRGFLTVELRKSEGRPLFRFEPAGQPTPVGPDEKP